MVNWKWAELELDDDDIGILTTALWEYMANERERHPRSAARANVLRKQLLAHKAVYAELTVWGTGQANPLPEST